MSSIDETDLKVLRCLLENSRMSNRSIAEKTELAVSTVSSRIEKLRKSGVIKGFSVLLDHEKLGYELTAITEITVSKGKLLEMERRVARIPSVCAVYDVTGLTDAIVIAKFRKRVELSAFTKSLLSLPFVERTNTRVVLTTVREDFGLL